MSQYVYASGRNALAGLSDDYFYGLSGPSSRNNDVKRAIEGRKYLAQQWVEQAAIAERDPVKFAKPKVEKTSKGKASVKISSFWSDWNKAAARGIRPVAQALRGLDVLPRNLRDKLINRPLDALIEMFDPVFNTLATPCTRTMNLHLKGGRRVEWFGRYIDIRISQPTFDRKLDKSTKTFLKKMRTIQAFIICFIKKPLEFSGECLKAGLDLAKGVVKAVGKAVDSAVMSIGAATQAVGKAVGDLAQQAADEAGKAMAGAASFVGGLFGLGAYADEHEGLGDGGLISLPAITGTTLIAGVAIENTLIFGVISAIVTAVAGTATTLGVTAMQTGAQKDVAMAAIKAGQSTEFTQKMPDGTAFSFKSGSPPVPVSSSSVVDALSDMERGPPTAPPPPDVRTLQAESAKTADDDDDDGFPVLPVALAAGVVALLLLKR